MLNALEGDLSDIEKGAFELKLKNDEQFKLEYNLYLQSKLQPDYAIVADFKDALKQNEDIKVIPFYYYFSSAVAAAILVILGLIYLFNQATLPVQELAKNTVVNETIKPLAKTIENKVVQEKTPSILANTTNTSPNKEKSKKIKSNDYSDLVKEPKNEIVASVQEAHFKTIDSLSLPSADKKNELGVIVPDGNTQARNFKTEEKKSNEYYSLKEMAVVKLKQKTLEEQAIEEQKKQGRLNKFNFWDLAQVVAKGINRLTNSDVSVNPEYNDSGELTAYAFNAGKLGFSKGK
ncbi:MAG: hypothetical protein JNL69_12680, partial [Bacteroidia bacterium]|nr:hypothetical protein [Bacteroidia bacterium]